VGIPQQGVFKRFPALTVPADLQNQPSMCLFEVGIMQKVQGLSSTTDDIIAARRVPQLAGISNMVQRIFSQQPQTEFILKGLSHAA
jgi:hypothetical protein